MASFRTRQYLLTPMDKPNLYLTRTLSVTCLALLSVLSGCVQQESVIDTAQIRSASNAAGQTSLIAPGPPPPDLAAPSDVIILERLRNRAEQRRVAAAKLRLDTGIVQQLDVWTRLRIGYAFPEVNNAKVQSELDWYTKRPDYIQRLTDRARLYLAYIVREAQRRDIPTELALLPVVESAFQPYARSHAGAMGIWQFIRSTGKHYGLKHTHWYDGRRDIVESTRAAFDYLERLNKHFKGDWLLSIAAYNSGEGNVGRAIALNRSRGKKTDFWSLRLPAETRAYVPRLLAVAALFKDPQRYGLKLDYIDDETYFEVVPTGGQIDLAKAAEMAKISLNELLLLNPGFIRKHTDPAGPHRLLIPKESASGFRQTLASLGASNQRLSQTQHRVKKGESLHLIAKKYGVGVTSLRQGNQLKSDVLSIGQTLTIDGVGVIASASNPNAYDGISKEVRNGILTAQRSTERRLHRIRKGESIWTISRRYKISMNKLMRWNGLNKKSVLRPGKRLVIWGKGRKPKTQAKTKTKSKTSVQLAATKKRPDFHIIRRGDNLWDISRQYRLSRQKLALWNQLQDDAILRIGQKLRLYPERSAQNSILSLRFLSV